MAVHQRRQNRMQNMWSLEMTTVHVYPNNDLIEHDTEYDDCLCGPSTEAVPSDEGSFGWLIVHHSLDGREAGD